MPFNYQSEYNRFVADWKNTFKLYQENGMELNEIWEMYNFDWNLFKSERCYSIHTLPLPELENSEDENAAALYRDYSNLTYEFEDALFEDRYSWIEEIENPLLMTKLKALSYQDVDLITMFVFEGYSHLEISRILGCSRNNITKKLARIKKYLS